MAPAVVPPTSPTYSGPMLFSSAYARSVLSLHLGPNRPSRPKAATAESRSGVIVGLKRSRRSDSGPSLGPIPR